MVESGDQTHPPPPAAAKVLFSKYELGRLLGCGASGKVYHARNLQTGLSVAIKIISKLRISKKAAGEAGPAARAAVTREIAIARRLRHPRIVRLLEVLASRTKIYFVLEFLKGGELFSKLSQGRLPEDHSRRLFRQLISAVGYCHSRGVFHRDLKPENLLLDDAGDLKVTDFGLSAVADDQIGGDALFHTLCGTPAYVAPEILSKKGYDGAKVDLWSCGVILYVLNAGYLPFNDPNLMEMYRKIYRGRYRCPRWTSPELRRLIGRLLDPNPETRITVEEILEDSWFRKGVVDRAEMEKMMAFHDAVEIEKSDGEDEADAEDGRQLNAFDLISFSSGLNLAGLFGEGSDRERFVTAEPAEGILGKMEELGRREGLAVRSKGKKGSRGVILEGQNGNLVARVEVYRLTGGLAVVEAGGSGDFWREKLKPVLQGPVAGVEE